MRKSRFGEEPIIAVLREHDAGVKTTDLCRKLGHSVLGRVQAGTSPWRSMIARTCASSGGPQPILNGPAKAATERLHLTRQRIHAGRLLSDQPGGLPDLKPEEARAAKDTAEQVVRAVLDWLNKPPA